MKTHRKIFHWMLPALIVLAVACAAPTPTVTTDPHGSALQQGLPPAMVVVKGSRLAAEPDRRGPPADFGKAIALGDGVLAVGAPSRTGGPDFALPGSVYIYRRGASGWEEETRLAASDQDDGFQYYQQFGSALALQDNLLFVGAPAADDPQAGDNSGAVYIFEYSANEWQEIAILKSPQPSAGAEFGSGLAVYQTHLGVTEGNYYEGGRLLLFEGQGGDWRLTTVIEALVSEGQHGGVVSFDLFGDTLAVATMTLEGEEANTRFSGEVLFYRFDGAQWVSNDGLPQDTFAMQLALDGQGTNPDHLALASPWDPQLSHLAGSISIFERQDESWTLAEILCSPDAPLVINWGSGYGGSVALHGDLLLTGGPGYSEDSFWDGVAYLYQHSDGRWVDQLRLIHTEDGGFGDFFGSAVEIFGNTLLISAPNEFGNAVYVYEVGVR